MWSFRIYLHDTLLLALLVVGRLFLQINRRGSGLDEKHSNGVLLIERSELLAIVVARLLGAVAT